MEGNITLSLPVGPESFQFSFCRKQELVGEIPVDHWWMPVTALYGQRGQRRRNPGNLTAVASSFWALCRRDGCHTERANRETYLLTRIVPYVRNQGSRNVFADACLNPRSRRAHAADEVREGLEPLLHAERFGRKNKIEFRDATGDVLGPPAFDEDAKELYLSFCRQLFTPAVDMLLSDEAAAVARVTECWKGWVRSFGRRGGHEVEKTILDILSYEARAALHDCYSDAWKMLLLPYLEAEYELDEVSRRFLDLWHVDQAEESDLGNEARFHLFHGHVFGLHPIGGMLLQTATGRSLMGAWLNDPTDPNWERLLHAILITAHFYTERRDCIAFDRRRQPASVGQL